MSTADPVVDSAVEVTVDPAVDSSVDPSAPTVADWMAEGRRRLVDAARASTQAADIEPREAFLLLGEVLGWSEAQIRARDERRLNEEDGRRFMALVRRRCAGEPMAYILGRREFYGRDFRVDSNVLIPRPETEHLIDEALADLRRVGSQNPRMLDVGTGSGCIAVTLACERSDATVVATDISLPALGVASGNSRSQRVHERIDFVAADLVSGIRLESFDLVVSNPPYVAPEAAKEMLPGVVDFEPHGALFAGDRGRAVIETLLDESARLRPGALVLIEIGYDQGEWIETAIGGRPYLERFRLIRDLAGHPRVAAFRRSA